MKKKLPSKKRLIKDADSAFSKFIRNRDQRCVLTDIGDCVTATKGIPGFLCAGHFVKRGKWTTRFDEVNVNGLCSNCNSRDNNYHEPYIKWFLQTYGQSEFDRLYIQSKEVMDKRMGSLRAYLEGIIEKYK